MNRPTLLSIGIVCNAIHALFALLGLACLGMALTGFSLFASLGEMMEGLPFVGPALMTLGMLLIIPFFLAYLIMLGACWGSWNGERGWTWTLVILSGIFLVNTGPLSVIIGLCTIIGGLQALGVIGGTATTAS